MMMALAAAARFARRARARRRDAAADRRAKTPARCRRSARATRTARSRSKKRPPPAARPVRSPGGGCQFLGTAATSQVVAEALGLALPHSALAPSGQPIWLDMARRSARAVQAARRARPQDARHSHATPRFATRWSCTRPAAARRICCCTFRPIAFAAGLRRPTVDDWSEVNRRVPRFVDVLPNGPVGSSDGPRLPGRRRAGGHAAPARAGPARSRTC